MTFKDLKTAQIGWGNSFQRGNGKTKAPGVNGPSLCKDLQEASVAGAESVTQQQRWQRGGWPQISRALE